MPARSRPPVSRWEQWLDRAVFRFSRLARRPSGLGQAYGLLRVFRLVELILDRQLGIRSIRPGGVLRYEVAPLYGRSFPLPGEPPVRHGERVIILHWDNRAVAAMSAATPSTYNLTWRLARTAIQDMRALARMAESGAFPPDVRAVWAETIVYTSLARLGFATRPAPRTFRTPFARLFQLSMLAIYGREGLQRIVEGRVDNLQLGEAWMGLARLRHTYAPDKNARQAGAEGAAKK